MSLKYNNINLSINSSYILAESISIGESSPQKPIFNLNNNVAFDNVPTTLKNSISISYYMEPMIEPNYPVVNNLTNDTTTPQLSIINIGNIFITGYLNSFSFQLSPNGLIKANSSFDIFYSFTGHLLNQNILDSQLYDTSQSSGLAHYWAGQFYSGSSMIVDNNILQLNYSAQIRNTPIYSLSNPYPVQIYINGITESIDLLAEQHINLKHTGQVFNSNRPDLQTLVLSGIASTGFIRLFLSDFQLQEIKYDINLDNIILYNNSYSRSR